MSDDDQLPGRSLFGMLDTEVGQSSKPATVGDIVRVYATLGLVLDCVLEASKLAIAASHRPLGGADYNAPMQAVTALIDEIGSAVIKLEEAHKADA